MGLRDFLTAMRDMAAVPPLLVGSNEMSASSSIGRRRREGRVNAILDTSAGKTSPKNAIGTRDALLNSTSFRNLTLTLFTTLIRLRQSLKLSLYSKSFVAAAEMAVAGKVLFL
jgi:hypothetical protein